MTSAGPVLVCLLWATRQSWLGPLYLTTHGGTIAKTKYRMQCLLQSPEMAIDNSRSRCGVFLAGIGAILCLDGELMLLPIARRRAPSNGLYGIHSTAFSGVMFPLKSEPVEALDPLNSSKSSPQELHHWKYLVFSPNMSHDPSRSGHRNARKSRSDSNPALAQSGGPNRVNVQDAALLAQFTAAGSGLSVDNGFPHGMPSTQYPNLGPSPGFYGNFYHHNSMSQQPSIPPLSSLDFAWSQLSPQQQHDLRHYDPNQQVPSPLAPTFVPSHYHSPQSMPQDPPSPPGSVTAEEKRRRNTAASARFRIKKKQKTVNLERSVSDLTGRAEELKREVGDLRRENGWLKEIVMLKGTRFVAANVSNRMVLNHAAALAAGGLPDSSSGGEGTSPQHYEGEDGEDEESESSDDETPNKGKGKASAKH